MRSSMLAMGLGRRAFGFEAFGSVFASAFGSAFSSGFASSLDAGFFGSPLDFRSAIARILDCAPLHPIHSRRPARCPKQ